MLILFSHDCHVRSCTNRVIAANDYEQVEASDWAIMEDTSVPVTNFHFLVPDMAFVWAIVLFCVDGHWTLLVCIVSSGRALYCVDVYFTQPVWLIDSNILL